MKTAARAFDLTYLSSWTKSASIVCHLVLKHLLVWCSRIWERDKILRRIFRSELQIQLLCWEKLGKFHTKTEKLCCKCHRSFENQIWIRTSKFKNLIFCQTKLLWKPFWSPVLFVAGILKCTQCSILTMLWG